MAETYELTLTENYVSDWDFYDAIRELIQNGTDQEILDTSNHFDMIYDPGEKVLRFVNATSKLKINTLLLGRSSKTNNSDTVGQFGEGYKIAALVLNRIGKTFTIYNNNKNEVWTSKFTNSKKWLEKILQFTVTKNETDNKGLVIEIGNVTYWEYEGISDIWLQRYEEKNDVEKIPTMYGEILLNDELSGRIFVNGLSVNSKNEMHYGYNFKPKYIKLERDRRTCDDWEMGYVTTRMICEAVLAGSLSIYEVTKLADMDAKDIYHMSFAYYEENVAKVKELLLQQFDAQYLDSIPVETQEEYNRVKTYGGKPVIVPQPIARMSKDTMRARIKKLSMENLDDIPTVKEQLERWLNAWFGELPGDAIDEFRNILKKMD